MKARRDEIARGSHLFGDLSIPGFVGTNQSQVSEPMKKLQVAKAGEKKQQGWFRSDNSHATRRETYESVEGLRLIEIRAGHVVATLRAEQLAVIAQKLNAALRAVLAGVFESRGLSGRGRVDSGIKKPRELDLPFLSFREWRPTIAFFSFWRHGHSKPRRVRSADPASLLCASQRHHTCADSILSKSRLGTAPTMRSTISPFLKSRIVGMLIMP